MKGFNFEKQTIYATDKGGKNGVEIIRMDKVKNCDGLSTEKIRNILLSWKIENKEATNKLFDLLDGKEDSDGTLVIFSLDKTIMALAYIYIPYHARSSVMIGDFVVNPAQQQKGYGRRYVRTLFIIFEQVFHIKTALALPVPESVGFWKKCGFEKPKNVSFHELMPDLTIQIDPMVQLVWEYMAQDMLVKRF